MSTEEKVFEYADEIASNLGVAAEQVYGALMKQAIVSGVTSIVWAAISVGVIIFSIYAIAKVMKDYSNSEESTMFTHHTKYFGKEQTIIGAGVIVVGGTLIIGLSIGAVFMVNNATTALLNPEYWALKEILSALTVDK